MTDRFVSSQGEVCPHCGEGHEVALANPVPEIDLPTVTLLFHCEACDQTFTAEFTLTGTRS